MQPRMAGKCAIITGGAGGIGSATAALFCAEGAKVLLVDRDEAALRAASYRIRGEVQTAALDTFLCDITVPEQAAAAVAHAVAGFGALNVLVNNAAIRRVSSVATSKLADWQAVIAVNLLGAVNFCAAAAPALRAAGRASVVNVSSVYGVMGREDWAIYDSTKAALLALTRSFACEEAKNGIRSNAVCAAATLTPFTIGRARARGKTEADLRREGMPVNLLGRWAEPPEMAYPILWLASDEASFVTGATFMIDGGRSIV
jgi:meso-butanediol dehydrogenase/(S,S)-butanediol dehydrogenase/diacetyl reductase